MMVWSGKHIYNSRIRSTYGLARSIEPDDKGQRGLEMDDLSRAVSEGADPALSTLAMRILFAKMAQLTL
jgi:hypothetical protein